MAICHKCGSEIDDQFSVCPVCCATLKGQGDPNKTAAPVNAVSAPNIAPPAAAEKPMQVTPSSGGETPSAPVAPLKKKKKTGLVVILIIVGLLVGSLVLCIGGGLIFGFSRTKESAPNGLANVYGIYCSSTYATLSGDGNSLTIDTNPSDVEEPDETNPRRAIQNVNNSLGFPGSVWEDMQETRALDGVQYYYGTDYTVSWTYHPDKGLEVTYTANSN